MEKKMNTAKQIPFGKPVRLGNFKMWRSNVSIGKGKEKSSLECINVSNMDGSWLIRIPSTFEMFGMLTVAYQWVQSEDASERQRGTGFIRSAFSNMAYVSAICNGYYHHGIEMLTAAYSDPSLLKEGDEKHEKYLDEARGVIERFLQWREVYEKQMEENAPTEQDEHREEIAEEAMKILDGDSELR